jgi:hypothetical protein
LRLFCSKDLRPEHSSFVLGTTDSVEKGPGPDELILASDKDIAKRRGCKLSADTSRHAFAPSWAKIKWAINQKRFKMKKKKHFEQD